MKCGAPLSLCRTTNMSACIADRLSTVSSRLSPLLWEETPMFRLITSADSRFAAISKVVRVRVEGSKNRLKTALPRSSGSFFTLTPTKDLAVSRISHRISGGQPLERQQMVQLAVLRELRVGRVEPHGQGSSSRSTRASRPSASRVSSMLCPAGTSMVAPTNCAAIGSCRPPRSTRAASFTFPGRP